MYYGPSYKHGVSNIKKIIKFKFIINNYTINVIITDKLWKENCYLVTENNSGAQVIIDPGASSQKIIEKIKKNGNGSIEFILLTHAHFDHIGAVSSISKYFESPCLLHRNDYKLMMQGNMYALKFGGKFIKIPKNVTQFSSGHKINITDIPIEIIETPGHTKGSVTYLFDGFLFTGDTLLYKSIGRADLPGSDLGRLKFSVDKILDNSNEEFIIFSGHGTQWSISEAKKWWEDGRSSLPQHNMFIKS